ncbi:hypothetical protein [Plesiomonas sp.]|uniref:hypothetical protein n=1 Tax=Plesiomonas sp. TaxID=2486279 RepID=UPI003F31335A
MMKITTLPIPMYRRTDEKPVNMDIKHVELLILGKKPDMKLSTLDHIFDFFKSLLGEKTKQQKHNELNKLFDTFILKTNCFRSQSKSINNILDMGKNEGLYTLLCCINTIDMTEKSQIKNYSFRIDNKKDQGGHMTVTFLFNENEVSNFMIKDNVRNKIFLDDGTFNYNQSENTYSIKESHDNDDLLDSVLKDFISKTIFDDMPTLLIDNKFNTKT